MNTNTTANDNNSENLSVPPRHKQPHGFLTLSPERRKEISSSGGKAAHAKGKAHSWTPEEAKAASMLGVAKRREKAAAKKAMTG